MATTRTNRELVQQAFDSLNDQDRTAFENLHTDTAVLHDGTREIRGIDAIADHEFGFFEVFPDLTVTPEQLVADGDLVAVRWSITGTQHGAFRGVEPTGTEVEFSAMAMFRIEDDRIAEVWLVSDQLGFMEQLGIVEVPGR